MDGEEIVGNKNSLGREVPVGRNDTERETVGNSLGVAPLGRNDIGKRR